MAGLSSVSVTLKPLSRSFSSSNSRHSHTISSAVFSPSLRFDGFKQRKILTVCFVVDDRKQSSPMDDRPESTSSTENLATSRRLQKAERKENERFTYLIAAVMSSFGITSMAIMAVYYRFSWQMEVKKLKEKRKSIFFVRVLKLKLDFLFRFREVKCLYQKCLVHLLSPLVLR